MRLLMLLAFLAVPVLEVLVLIQAGQVIGGWATAGLLLAGAAVGTWLVRREGRRVWRALQESLSGGQMPERELSDAAIVVAGGTLLLLPGFISDVVGLACVLPPTRPLVRRVAARLFERRMRRLAESSPFGGPLPGGASPFGGGPFGPPFGPGPQADGPAGGPATGTVIRGQVIHDEPADASSDAPVPRRRDAGF
ncbi:FxsA family protein [Spongiactinospora rosea]|uniref:FxsA family protein n=1 Tax=Spongiactinospora rosea TaxID=2248750 RepID=A0A366LZ56_9ACTN|nr:FxsA family protein [Spongiactinospora rosea]RBQ18833.1 FxsA family protein [Spongiactinospora rosea]